MEPSILKSTKKILGLAPEYTAYDQEVITYINMAFSTLNQLDIGNISGFSVQNEDQHWADYTTSQQKINSIKNYVFLKVRLLFDPPTNAYAIESLQTQLEEVEWRLTTLD